VNGSLAADYEALTTGAGAVRTGREVLRVWGPGAQEYLQGQLSQDLDRLDQGSSVDSLVLEPRGKLDALVRVTRARDEELLLDVAGGFGDAVQSRLARFKLRVKADIEKTGWHVLSLRGAGVPAPEDLERGSGGTELVVPYSWNGLVGADLLGEDPAVPEGFRNCSLDALEVLRVEAGIPEMGRELDERTIPAEAALLERCVSFTKGCYTGQELVARLEARGNKVARRLRGIVVEAQVAPGSVVGCEVLSDGKVVGSVTSAVWSPRLEAVGALGYLRREVVAPCQVELRIGQVDGGGTEGVSGEAGPGASVPAEARELPLVA
jgi:tRNA-modifying protein YgfZ